MKDNLQRAKLLLLEPSAKGPWAPSGKEVSFKFNPKEYAISKSAELASQVGGECHDPSGRIWVR